MQQPIHILTLLLPLVGAATISKRGVDRGTFKLQCNGGEGACNNAAFYINCISGGDNEIAYIGPDSKKGDDNRIESGCRAAIRQEGGAAGALTGSTTSVCQQFPYGMQFIPDPDRLSQDAAEKYQCDEWPPASAEQPDYAAKTHPNSLRCIKGSENAYVGNQLRNIYQGHTANTAGQKNKMDPGDHFKVDFDTTGADMSKLRYVVNPKDCTNDGMQFQMTKRPNKGGLITAGVPEDNDNQYTLHGKTKAVGMCSIDFHRESDEEFTNICVTDEANTDCATGGKATIKTAPGSHVIKGLKQGDVTMTRTGALGTKMEFKFDNIKWDTTSRGTGKGPGGSRGLSTHTWCRELDGAGKTKEYTCYFPC